MKIQESGENYLETIYLISLEKEDVHSVDVANRLGFSKPSITRAMGILQKAGYITFSGNHIQLTVAGRERAEYVYRRHCTLTRFLELLGVSAEQAAEDACRLEHVVSDETFVAVRRFVQEKT